MEDGNKLLSPEEFQEKFEKAILSKLGLIRYKSEVGFTQEQIYIYGGRTDSVFNLVLRNGSESYNKFGEELTIKFYYSLKERQKLEKDRTSLNLKPNIQAILLVPFDDEDLKIQLRNEGIMVKDIIEMTVSPSFSETNTFPSKEKRQLKILEIPFETEGAGKDIGWMYGFLKKLSMSNIALMPEDKAQYLAYKIILEPEELTENEKNEIFDKDGKICNNSVAYYWLLWRKAAGKINKEQIENLKRIVEIRFLERFTLFDKCLNDLGSNISKFAKEYPNQMAFLYNKILIFRDKNFNFIGRQPLYMDFNSFLHIYFRHVRELNVFPQFADKDKFQLNEEDIMKVINHIMLELNKEYQHFKERMPDGRFCKYGEQALYFNGDYYNVYVNKDGSIDTFYKGTGTKR